MSDHFSNLGARRREVYERQIESIDGVIKDLPVQDLVTTINTARDQVVLQFASDPFQGGEVIEEEVHPEIFEEAAQRLIGRASEHKKLKLENSGRAFLEGTQDFATLKRIYIEVASGWKAPDFGGPDRSAERDYAGLYAKVHGLRGVQFTGAGLSSPVVLSAFNNFLAPKLSGFDRLVVVRDSERVLISGRGHGRPNLPDDMHFNLQHQGAGRIITNGKGLEADRSLVVQLTAWVQKIQEAQKA